jgi:PAS domain S-box-containing protein
MPLIPCETSKHLRQRAEEQLGVRQGGCFAITDRAATPEQLILDSLRNFHELQVHQIELAMQNDELRQTRDELELMWSKYTKLYSELSGFAPISYFSTDARGMIRAVNRTGAQPLETERGPQPDKPVSTLIADADGKEIFFKHFDTIAERLETEIQDTREYAENIVETVREPLVVLNSDLKILTANRSFYETFKVAPEETIGNFIYDVGNRQWDIPKLRVLFEDILPLDTVFNGYEVEHDFPGIGHKTILLNARQIFRKNIGSHIILLAMEDITERKQLETEIQDAREYAENIVETVHKPLVVLSSDLKILTANHNFYDTFKVAPEETIGSFIYDVGNRQWDIPRLRMLFEDILPNNTAFNGYEVEHDFPGIGRRIILLNARQIFRKKIGSHIILLAMEDITLRKRGEIELEKKNAEIEQFIYTISHDLRSPLVTVKTFMGFLEKDMLGNDQNQLDQDIQFIHGAADKMKLLLDELLELSRIGRIGTPPVRLSLKELLAEVLDILAGIIKVRAIDIHMPDTDLMLFGDRLRLCQVWQNLIENAVKYSRDGSLLRIELGIELVSGETVFFVKDNGIGIDPEYRTKIFGIFEKLDPKSPGAGMGLSIIQRIVEKCGGRIWVESDGLDKGSCFFFTLPDAVVINGEE